MHGLHGLRPSCAGVPQSSTSTTLPELFATLFDRPPDHPLVRLIRVEERVSACDGQWPHLRYRGGAQLLRARGIMPSAPSVMTRPTSGSSRAPRARTPPSEGELRVVYPTAARRPLRVETLVAPSHRCASREQIALDITAPMPRPPPASPPSRRDRPEGVRIARSDPVAQIPARVAEADPAWCDSPGASPSCCCRSSCSSTCIWACPVVASRLP